MDMEWVFPLSRYGKYWREGRRLLDRSFRSGTTTSHGRLIEDKIRMFLGLLLATPNAFREHIDLLVFATMFSRYNVLTGIVVFKEKLSCTSPTDMI